MTDKLFNATLSIARKLGIVREWRASAAGSTTTLVDTVARLEQNDAWNGGTIWITSDAGGAGAAPEGEYSMVSDFVNSSGTLTFTALSSATAALDRYAIAKPIVPLDMLITAVNTVLSSCLIPVEDTTSLDTISGQTEYTLPAAVTRGNLVGVRYQTLDDSNDNRWMTIHNWFVTPGVTGAQDTLILPPTLASGIDLSLVYLARHPDVYLATDNINEAIDLDALGWHGAAEIANMLLGEPVENEYITGQMNRYMAEAERKPLVRNVGMAKHYPQFNIVSGTSLPYAGTVGKVRL